MESKKAIRILAAAALPALLVGCASHRASYRPAEPTTEAMGYRATLYDVRLDSQRLAIVKVYSEGGYKAPADGSQAVIDVRLTIRNVSQAPLSLELGKCELAADTVNGNQVIKQPVRSSGLEPVPAGGFGHVALFYAIEGGLRPDQVDSFDFDWTLKTDKGEYANTTPFMRRIARYGYAYYPLYGGWWGYPWGWGWVGWGWDWAGGGWVGGGRGEHERGEGEHERAEHERGGGERGRR